MGYAKLVLAPGATPLLPPIPGTDLPGVFTLCTLQDADRIKAAVDKLIDVSEAVVPAPSLIFARRRTDAKLGKELVGIV